MPTNFKNSTRETRRRVLFCVVLLGIAAGLFILPYQFRSEAGSNTRKGFFDRTVSSDLANYDIRSDKAAYDKVAAFRQAQSRSATEVADIRDNFVRGEASLRSACSEPEDRLQHRYSDPRSDRPRCEAGTRFSHSRFQHETLGHSPQLSEREHRPDGRQDFAGQRAEGFLGLYESGRQSFFCRAKPGDQRYSGISRRGKSRLYEAGRDDPRYQ